MIILPAIKSGSFNNFVNVFHNVGNNLWCSIAFHLKEDFCQRLFVIRNDFLISLVFYVDHVASHIKQLLKPFKAIQHTSFVFLFESFQPFPKFLKTRIIFTSDFSHQGKVQFLGFLYTFFFRQFKNRFRIHDQFINIIPDTINICMLMNNFNGFGSKRFPQ